MVVTLTDLECIVTGVFVGMLIRCVELVFMIG